jgi:hypothetical protein
VAALRPDASSEDRLVDLLREEGRCARLVDLLREEGRCARLVDCRDVPIVSGRWACSVRVVAGFMQAQTAAARKPPSTMRGEFKDDMTVESNMDCSF